MGGHGEVGVTDDPWRRSAGPRESALGGTSTHHVDEIRTFGRLFDFRAREARTLEDRLANAWQAVRATRDGICCKQAAQTLRLRYLNAMARTTVSGCCRPHSRESRRVATSP